MSGESSLPIPRLLLKVEEVCKIIGMGHSKVYALIESGELPSVRIDSSIRVPVRALQQWIDELPAAQNIKVQEEEEEIGPEPEQITVDSSIEYLEISVRLYNCLRDAGIKRVGQILQFTDRELLSIKNLGTVCLREVKQVLERVGLSLPPSVVPFGTGYLEISLRRGQGHGTVILSKQDRAFLQELRSQAANYAAAVQSLGTPQEPKTDAQGGERK